MSRRPKHVQAMLPGVEYLALHEKLALFFGIDYRALVERARDEGLEHAHATSCAMVLMVLVNRSDADGLVRLEGRRGLRGLDLLRAESQTEEKTCRRALRLLRREGVVLDDERGQMRVSWSRMRSIGEARTEAERKRSNCPPSGTPATAAERPERPSERPERPSERPERPSGTANLAPASIEDRARGSHSAHRSPPAPPEPDEAGGGEDELRPSERERAVLEAYPGPAGVRPHPEAVLGLDLAALRRAMAFEADPRSGEAIAVTLDEVLAAVLRYAATKPPAPLRPRKWFANRGYMDAVRWARNQAAGKPKAPARPTEPLPPAIDWEAVNAQLDGLEQVELEALHRAVCESDRIGSWQRERFRRQDPRSKQFGLLRVEMAAELRLRQDRTEGSAAA